MNPTRYRQLRKDYPASTALAIARMEHKARDFWSDDTAEWTTPDGWTFTAEVNFDPEPDLSYHGEWTNDPTDAIDNPEYRYDKGQYPYFRPESSRTADLLPYLRRTYGRHDAYMRVLRYQQEDMERARTTEDCYCVTVIAAHPYYGTGEASLYDIEDDHSTLPYCAEVAHELAGEAQHEAMQSTARRFSHLTNYPPAFFAA